MKNVSAISEVDGRADKIGGCREKKKKMVSHPCAAAFFHHITVGFAAVGYHILFG